MTKYTVVTGTLVARTAAHIGSGEGNEGFDALLRRNAAGNLLIPGTAIAGALRGLLTRLAPRLFEKDGVCKALLDERARGSAQEGCHCIVCQLFGDIEPSDVEAGGEEESGGEQEKRCKASQLLVFNAQLKDGQSAKPLVRDGVGIDRATGAAARAGRAKFDLEVLPTGTEFDLRMELRIRDEADVFDLERLLAAGLAEWQAGRAWVGGDVARGLGGFELLDDLQYGTRNLDDDKELMEFLTDDHPWKSTSVQTGWLQRRLKDNFEHVQVWDEGRFKGVPVARRWAEWSLLLEAQGPLLSNDTTASGLSGFDHAPLLSRLHDWTKPVLAGAGLRGVLRSQAERITRTLTTHRALAERGGREAQDAFFREHCPACDPLARRARPIDNTVALECCDSLLRHRVGHDENKEVKPEQVCLACRLFGSTRSGSRLVVEDAPYAGKRPPDYKILDFLAIDRFTGGGAEHFKFDALALWKPSFRLRVFLDNYEDWEMGWLTLVLRDLAEGWLRVGFGAAKGFGQVKVNAKESTLHLATLDQPPEGEPPSSVYHIQTYNLDQDELNELRRRWVEAFNSELRGYRRPDQRLHLPADSLFNEQVYKVYGPLGGEAR
jgi:CRISPR/Cas system CSM-associated protein Csm3 (group 7 of RAMP superfamily)